MNVLEAVVLGFVQGFTEFLPVSSSGHLVLAQHLFHIQRPEIFSFDVYVHVGTLISIIVVLWEEIRAITKGVLGSLAKMDLARSYQEDDWFRLGIVLLVGTIPAGIIGVLFRYQVRDAFTDPKLVSMNLVISGFILFLTRFSRPLQEKKLGLVGAFVVGLGQALAVLPGISRTGSTISTAMYLRMTPLRAARLSFLLSLPVIVGAAVIETGYFLREGSSVGFLPVFAGTITSAVTGYIAIRLLLRITEKGQFSVFSFYCLAIGTIGILFI